MNITQETQEDLTALVKIEISPTDYLPQVDKSLKEIRKTTTLKGFRKGHVPVGVLKKMYGNQVLAEEIDRLINDHLNKYLEENKINILGNPIPKEEEEHQHFDIKNEQAYKFTFELGLSPDFDLQGADKSTKVPHYGIKVGDSEVNEELERIQKQFGETINPEDAIVEDDVIYVDLFELNDDESEKEDGVKNSPAIAMDMISDKTAGDAISALKIGESTVVNIFQLADKSKAELGKHFLDITEDKLDSVGEKFKLTLQKINRIKPAEFNQEFFDKVFGPDAVKSEEEFREKLREEIANAYSQHTDSRLNYDVKQALLKANPVELPDDFLKRWIHLSNDKPISQEQIDAEYEHFADNLRWNLIVNKVGKGEELEVTSADIKAHTIEALKKQFGANAGMLNDEQMSEFGDTMMKNKEHVQKTYEQLMDEKLFEYIKGQIEIEDKKVSLEEFKALNEN